MTSVTLQNVLLAKTHNDITVASNMTLQKNYKEIIYVMFVVFLKYISDIFNFYIFICVCILFRVNRN